jgi:hypothetical protein
LEKFAGLSADRASRAPALFLGQEKDFFKGDAEYFDDLERDERRRDEMTALVNSKS